MARALSAWGERDWETPDGKRHDWASGPAAHLVSMQRSKMVEALFFPTDHATDDRVYLATALRDVRHLYLDGVAPLSGRWNTYERLKTSPPSAAAGPVFRARPWSGESRVARD